MFFVLIKQEKPFFNNVYGVVDLQFNGLKGTEK